MSSGEGQRGRKKKDLQSKVQVPVSTIILAIALAENVGQKESDAVTISELKYFQLQ